MHKCYIISVPNKLQKELIEKIVSTTCYKISIDEIQTHQTIVLSYFLYNLLNAFSVCILTQSAFDILLI